MKTVEFLYALFGQVLDERDAFIEVRRPERLPDGASRKARIRQDFFRSVTELERELPRYLREEADGFECYFGVNLRSCKRGRREDVGCAGTLHLDIDFKDTPRDVAEQRLREFPLRPSAINHTGYGVHGYWFLDEPAEPHELDAVEAANYGLAQWFGGDACRDLARVLRLPGTHNLKHGRRVPVELLELHPERRYALGDFELVARPAPRAREQAVALADVPTELPIRFRRMLEHPEGNYLRAVWEGRYKPREAQASRSAHDMKLANLCAAYGLTREEIDAVLYHFPYGRGREGTPDYRARTIAKAFERCYA